MRAFLHPANPGYPSSTSKISTKTGLPLQSARTIRQLRSQISASSMNVGNVVHNEAIAKTFEFDTALSVLGGIEGFYRTECRSKPKEFQQKLSENFDAVFFSFANLIAPPLNSGKEELQRQQFSRLAEIVRNINIPLFVFGVGMQERLVKKEQILPELVEFMLEVDQKAEIFGCRGAETQSYLRTIGCNNVKVLGCPSLYVYPSHVQSIRPLDDVVGKHGITAGYLDRKHFLGYQPERMASLSKIASHLNLSYVFQNDLLTLSELEDVPDLYSDADNRCDPKIINSYIESFGYRVPIGDYRFFRDARSWRQYASTQDYYFGDRFHGGVVSLQTGRPALFIHNDVRVKELAEHFSLPSVSLAETTSGDVTETLEKGLSRDSIEAMHDTYSMRLNEYFDTASGAGLVPLNGLHKRRQRKPASSEPIAAIMKMKLGAVSSNTKIAGAMNLAAMSCWSLAGSERLISVLAEFHEKDAIEEVIKLVLAREPISTPDESVYFRIAQVLFRMGLDQDCESLLRHFHGRPDAVWTERVARILIDVLIRRGNLTDADEYLRMAKERGCLGAKLVHSLGERVKR